jgi:hypothetical protein
MLLLLHRPYRTVVPRILSGLPLLAIRLCFRKSIRTERTNFFLANSCVTDVFVVEIVVTVRIAVEMLKYVLYKDF